MRIELPDVDFVDHAAAASPESTVIAYRLSVTAGIRHTPLLRLAHRLRAAARREACEVIDHHFVWRNGGPVLVVDLQAPDTLLATRNRLYGCTEQLLDEAMFNLPWDTVPLISEGTSSGIRTGNGLVVHMECLLKPEPCALSGLALDALERAVDTKQLALALCTRVLAAAPADAALDALLQSRFSSRELELLRRRAAGLGAPQDQPESSAMLAVWGEAQPLDFLAKALNRLGFTERESAYLLLLADHLARASHKEIAA
ncbi:MAG: hypothetical protein H4O13_03395 [Xanthomonadales bacterium]|nr:hypothetical protein [Xanthomonadales bacterium]